MPTILHRAARRLTRHLGAHGSGLLLIAFLWIVIGLRELIQPPPNIPASAWHGIVPVALRLFIWWAPALLCIGAAVDRNGPRRDGFALGAAVIAPAFLAASFTWSWAVGGYTNGWYVAVLYVGLVGIVALVAAYPEDSPPHT